MLMEHNVLRPNWPAMGEHDYPAGSHPTVEQQHFPSLAPSFHSYAPYAPSAAAQRFKDDASPRTFSSLYLPHPHHQQQQHASFQPPSSNSSDSHHAHHYSSSVLGSQLPLPHHHSLPLSLSIPRPSAAAGPVTSAGASKKASEEERKAKHREAQRRFVKRKKAEMLQLKQFAVELELQYQLLEVLSECATLERENRTLEDDIATARDQSKSSSEPPQVDANDSSEDAVVKPIGLPELNFHFEW